MGKTKATATIKFTVKKKYANKGMGDVLNLAGLGIDTKASVKMLRAYKASLTKKAKQFEKMAKQEAKQAIRNIQGVYKAGFGATPAIQKLMEDGVVDEKGNIYFNVKGHRVQDLQRIWYRLKKFNESETATAKGATDFLHQMYNNIGLEYTSNKDAIAKASLFFEISSKVKQLMQAQGYYGEALSYQRIWESVREEINFNTDEWKNATMTIDVAERVLDRLNQTLQEIEEVDELEEFLRNK